MIITLVWSYAPKTNQDWSNGYDWARKMVKTGLSPKCPESIVTTSTSKPPLIKQQHGIFPRLSSCSPVQKAQWTKQTSPSISHQMKLLIINERSSCRVNAGNEKEYIYRRPHSRCIRNVGFWEIKENIIIAPFQTPSFPALIYVIPSLPIPFGDIYSFVFSIIQIKPSIFSLQYSSEKWQKTEREACERERAQKHCVNQSHEKKLALGSYRRWGLQSEESYLRLDMLNALSFMYQPKGNISSRLFREIRCKLMWQLLCKLKKKKQQKMALYTVPSPSSAQTTILLTQELLSED